MYIKLTVKKETFEKYLLELGFIYSIEQYSQFIYNLSRIIYTDIMALYNNKELTKNLSSIVKSTFDIRWLENPKLISGINEDYLRRLINSGKLNHFFSSPEIEITQNDKEDFYRIELLSKIKYLYITNSVKSGLLKNERLKRLKRLKKYVKKYNIDMSLSDKEKDNIMHSIIYFYLVFGFGNYKYDSNPYIIEKIVENITFDDCFDYFSIKEVNINFSGEVSNQIFSILDKFNIEKSEIITCLNFIHFDKTWILEKISLLLKRESFLNRGVALKKIEYILKDNFSNEKTFDLEVSFFNNRQEESHSFIINSEDIS